MEINMEKDKTLTPRGVKERTSGVSTSFGDHLQTLTEELWSGIRWNKSTNRPTRPYLPSREA